MNMRQLLNCLANESSSHIRAVFLLEKMNAGLPHALLKGRLIKKTIGWVWQTTLHPICLAQPPAAVYHDLHNPDIFSIDVSADPSAWMPLDETFLMHSAEAVPHIRLYMVFDKDIDLRDHVTFDEYTLGVSFHNNVPTALSIAEGIVDAFSGHLSHNGVHYLSADIRYQMERQPYGIHGTERDNIIHALERLIADELLKPKASRDNMEHCVVATLATILDNTKKSRWTASGGTDVPKVLVEATECVREYIRSDRCAFNEFDLYGYPVRLSPFGKPSAMNHS